MWEGVKSEGVKGTLNYTSCRPPPSKQPQPLPSNPAMADLGAGGGGAILEPSDDDIERLLDQLHK